MRADTDPCSLSKVQLRNAINAADDWLEANFAAYNASLTAAARTGLTGKQKARLLTLVINRRLELS